MCMCQRSLTASTSDRDDEGHQQNDISDLASGVMLPVGAYIIRLRLFKSSFASVTFKSNLKMTGYSRHSKK